MNSGYCIKGKPPEVCLFADVLAPGLYSIMGYHHIFFKNFFNVCTQLCSLKLNENGQSAPSQHQDHSLNVTKFPGILNTEVLLLF